MFYSEIPLQGTGKKEMYFKFCFTLQTSIAYRLLYKFKSVH